VASHDERVIRETHVPNQEALRLTRPQAGVEQRRHVLTKAVRDAVMPRYAEPQRLEDEHDLRRLERIDLRLIVRPTLAWQ